MSKVSTKQVRSPKEAYLVTGQEHGSIVIAVSQENAICIFMAHYEGEGVLTVKVLDRSLVDNI